MANEIDPNILKRFEIERKLGRGAYGIVWKINERNSKKNFALKKCFDSIWRDGLYLKLYKSGLSNKFVRIIIDIYRTAYIVSVN